MTISIKKRMISISLRVLLLFILSQICLAETTDSITQYGITWYFEDEHEYGRFANDDYWVVGPVTITRITPDFTGTIHGWEVSPMSPNQQGLDSRAGGFSAARVPSLPYTVQPKSSVVKAKSFIDCDDEGAYCPNGDLRPAVRTAAVLTVLKEVPPDDGKEMFRPAYATDEKQFYYLDDLQTDLLPSFGPPGSVPSIDSTAGSIRRVQLDHVSGWSTRMLHPDENMPDYGSSISNVYSTAILRLLLNDTIEQKMPLLINTVQMGIDYIGMYKIGTKWLSNGGHSVGRKLPVVFAAVMLDDTDTMNAISDDQDTFDEGITIKTGANADLALFAQTGPNVDQYWKKLVYGCDGTPGSKTDMDPYGWIDGGCCVGCTYDNCCLFKPYKAEAIAMYMMPELKEVWDDDEFFDYVNRRVYHGAWAQPDPCAPVTGVCDGGSNDGMSCTAADPSVCGDGTCDYAALFDQDYRVRYGPDPDNPGGCILDHNPSDGIGRYPQHHGLNKDSGGYQNSFGETLWDMYRLVTCSNGIKDDDEEGVDCGGICEVDLDGDGYDRGMCSGGDCDDDASDDPRFIICPDEVSGCTKKTYRCAICIHPQAEEFCDGIDNDCDRTFHDDYYADSDSDGVNDCIDNCVLDVNPGQEDSDYDLIGDDCDPSFEFYEDFELMFDNNYSNPAPGGIGFVDVSGSGYISTSTHWGYSSRMLKITGPDSAGQDKLIITKKGDSWTDYELSLTAGDKYTNSGIVLNYLDQDNHYWLSLRDSNLRKVEEGQTQTITGTGDGIALSWGGDNKDYKITVNSEQGLEITARTGESERTFIDQDPHVDSGKVGFIVISGGSGNYFIADNINLSFSSAPFQCENEIDLDCDGCIDDSELLASIGSWKTGSLHIETVLRAIRLWMSSTGC